MRRPLADEKAAEEALPVECGLDYVVTVGGVWYLPPPRGRQRSTLYIYEFATGQTRAVYEAPKVMWAGLSVSPDGRRVLVTQVERGPSLDLMLAEGFR